MKLLKRFAAVGAAICLFVGICGATVEASTKAELEAKLAQIEEQQKQLQSEMAAVQNDKSQKKQYQQYLAQQIDLAEQEIAIREQNIALAQEEIDALEVDIAGVEQDIKDKQGEIDDGYELLKQRIRAMYIAGYDSTLSVLLGSSDFYDVLSNTQFLKRIAENDQALIDEMMDNKASLEQSKLELDDKKKKFEQDKVDIEASKAEFDAKKAELATAYEQNNAAIQALSGEEAELAAAQSQNKAAYDEIDAEIARIIAEEKKNADQLYYSGGQLAWPVPGNYGISSPFGWRTLWGVQDFHTGIDIVGSSSGVIKGATIVAAESGRVLVAEKYSNRGYGHYVLIDHGVDDSGVSIYTLYGHCQDVNVNVGDIVSRGQGIATVGTTGLSTGYHLHFEVRLDNQKVNPEPYLK